MDLQTLANSLQATLGAQLPGILGALGILIIGWLVAVAARAGSTGSRGFARGTDRVCRVRSAPPRPRGPPRKPGARARAAPRAHLGVVKANAYGHGLARAVRAFEAADGFALLDLNDAVSLREAGVTKPILLLEGVFEADDLQVLARARPVDRSCTTMRRSRCSKRSGCRRVSRVCLKLNTGMNRLGFSAGAVPAVFERLARSVGRRRDHADDAFRRCRRPVAASPSSCDRFERPRRGSRRRAASRTRRRCCAFRRRTATGCGPGSCSTAARRSRRRRPPRSASSRS